ncbi:MAG TPA: thiol:disulfide interchange protein DsbA/DsbL [Luteimonas sp.]|nr:thiol:disulfide interchange protein DsbA/DsbL [Luteimonas sp.]
MKARFPVLASLLLSLLLPVAALAATPAPGALVEGRDYELVDAGPWKPLDGKIEVVEVFAYTCPHCAEFEPKLEAWVAKLPDDVRFQYLPAAYDPRDPFARAFFVAEQAGAVGRTHAALFHAIHDEGLIARNATPGELAWFYGQHGIDQDRFRAALLAPAVDEQMKRAYDWARAIRLPGTPTLVVNGRYRIIAATHDDGLRIADQLIAQLRAAR